jgi:hypothetical protein
MAKFGRRLPCDAEPTPPLTLAWWVGVLSGPMELPGTMAPGVLLRTRAASDRNRLVLWTGK